MSEVSPRPWTYTNCGMVAKLWFDIHDKDGMVVAENVETNDATHIVKCVNDSEADKKRIAELEAALKCLIDEAAKVYRLKDVTFIEAICQGERLLAKEEVK